MQMQRKKQNNVASLYWLTFEFHVFGQTFLSVSKSEITKWLTLQIYLNTY